MRSLLGRRRNWRPPGKRLPHQLSSGHHICTLDSDVPPGGLWSGWAGHLQEDLLKLQRTLEATFAGLRDERAGTDYPVYALEHGLNDAQIDLLKARLASDFARCWALDARL